MVYLVMVYGFSAHFFIFAQPRIFSNTTVLSHGEIIELAVFWTFFALMVWSHMHTMCSDPGRIPLGYQYREEDLPDKFKNIILPHGLGTSSESYVGKRDNNRGFTQIERHEMKEVGTPGQKSVDEIENDIEATISSPMEGVTIKPRMTGK